MTNRGREILKTAFNTDNKIMRIFERIFDFVCLNLIFLISCIPLITIGVAKISLYHVLTQMKHSQHVSILKEYTNCFRRNMKYGLTLFCIEFAVFVMVSLDLYLVYHQTGFLFTAMKIVCFGILFLTLLFSLIIYPLVDKKKETLQDLFKITLLNLSFNMVKNLLLVTITLTLIFIYISSVFTFIFGSLYLVIAGFSTLGYLQLKIIDKMVTPKLGEL